MLARQMTPYTTDNGYIDTSIQRGEIPGFSQCLEHTTILSHLVQEAKRNKGNLTVVWLDLANTYRSMPHNLINKALEIYHIPRNIKQMINSYLGSFRLQLRTAKFNNTQELEKGFVTGRIVSSISVHHWDEPPYSSSSSRGQGPVTAAGGRELPIRVLMDDHTITSHVQGRWVLKILGAVTTWARMVFKSRKSQCMVIRKVKVIDVLKFQIQGEDK